MKMSELKKFDPVDYMQSHEDIELFLEMAMTNGGGVEHIKQAFLVAEKARAKLDKENNEISLNDLIASAIAKVMTNQKSVQFS
ncbi:Uncharacterised protein [Moraxella bovis]|uniref:Addiction module antidote protein n=2 Tax=Moraxella bovis TaxID=476 RepID=A0A378PS33_MORBO|nr:Uncharacterised protein [Moraxella bovis]